MVRYYCTCRLGTYRGHSPTINITEVDAEGICIYCRHYAVANPSEKNILYPRSRKGNQISEISQCPAVWSLSVGLAKFHAWKGESGIPFKNGFKKLERELYQKERSKVNEKSS